MKRLVFMAVGLTLAALPALIGLAGNPALSHRVPVRVPVAVVRAPATNPQVYGVAKVRPDGHGGDDHASPAPGGTKRIEGRSGRGTSGSSGSGSQGRGGSDSASHSGKGSAGRGAIIPAAPPSGHSSGSSGSTRQPKIEDGGSGDSSGSSGGHSGSSGSGS